VAGAHSGSGINTVAVETWQWRERKKKRRDWNSIEGDMVKKSQVGGWVAVAKLGGSG
jgi:hypothetical protein